MDIIIIEWDDAFSGYGKDGCTKEELMKYKSFSVVSVGFLLFENKERICIAASQQNINETFRDWIIIPKKYIIRRKKIVIK